METRVFKTDCKEIIILYIELNSQLRNEFKMNSHASMIPCYSLFLDFSLFSHIYTLDSIYILMHIYSNETTEQIGRSPPFHATP